MFPAFRTAELQHPVGWVASSVPRLLVGSSRLTRSCFSMLNVCLVWCAPLQARARHDEINTVAAGCITGGVLSASGEKFFYFLPESTTSVLHFLAG